MKNKVFQSVISVITLVAIFYVFINIFNIRPIVAYVFGGVLYALVIYYIQRQKFNN